MNPARNPATGSIPLLATHQESKGRVDVLSNTWDGVIKIAVGDLGTLQ